MVPCCWLVCLGGQEFIRALELALRETASPLSVAEECLRQRENRTGVDRIQDEVELALIKVSRVGNCLSSLLTFKLRCDNARKIQKCKIA